ncbi:hypothetical protein BJY17_002720 [Agromyces hippuratus]|uniref:Uncharacterized protein n=1 Tax=Agromyces hippuratus TaxID=286438 RepID=A0A852X1E6_9MICO|nr:hypothetical protein [Agromyces hippuratus]NYG21973.1 hypothetical protein [Agromyces hippuratus]
MAATTRTERAAATRAIAQSKRAESEVRSLAKELPRGTSRAWLERAVADARADRKAAEAERRIAPRRAAHRAAGAVAGLERATRISGLRRGNEAPLSTLLDADERARARVKLIKRHRAQAKQAQKMAKAIARGTIVAAVTTPSDAERRNERRETVARRRARGSSTGTGTTS